MSQSVQRISAGGFAVLALAIVAALAMSSGARESATQMQPVADGVCCCGPECPCELCTCCTAGDDCDCGACTCDNCDCGDSALAVSADAPSCGEGCCKDKQCCSDKGEACCKGGSCPVKSAASEEDTI